MDRHFTVKNLADKVTFLISNSLLDYKYLYFLLSNFSPLNSKLSRIIRTDAMYVREIWKRSDYVDSRVA